MVYWKGGGQKHFIWRTAEGERGNSGVDRDKLPFPFTSGLKKNGGWGETETTTRRI